MSRIGDATLDLVRDRDTATLDWILAELTRRGAHGRRLDITWATGEIHLALVNAGWHHDCHDSPDGEPIHCYQRRPSIARTADALLLDLADTFATFANPPPAARRKP